MKLFQKIINNLNELQKRSGMYIHAQTMKEVLSVSTGSAIFLLELASRAGHFKPCYQVRCPSCNRVLAVYDYQFQIPVEIKCIADEEHKTFLKKKDFSLVERVYKVI